MQLALTTRVRLGGTALLVLALVAMAPFAAAQNPTGTLTGTVTDQSGAALPGVTVTATSPSLQGARVTQTGGNGSYKLAFLPPGDYRVTYELDSFATVGREVKISAAMPTQSDVEMALAEFSGEVIEVRGQQADISETNTGSTTLTQSEVEKLPVARNLNATVQLTPGVHDTGPNNNITIAGAMSFENLWTINGVVINENVRGQELDLFIEDAIQETTTQVSGVSAEYGRFQGGVINAITRSGGNEFSGSLRANVTNDDWISENELSPERVDDVNQTYEATLGGYLWKDHLWFFGAGRDLETSNTTSLQLTNLPVTQDTEQQRLEGKLTATVADSHTFIGSYFEIDQTSTNTFFFGNIDDDGLTDREDPQDLSSLNYTGILTPSFFVEAQYSERNFDISVGGGAKSRTLVDGTLMRTRQGAFRYHTPTFCGVCEQEERNNEDVLAKGSWFLSTEGAGTHDVVFGYDAFTDIRFSINHQTGSDFTVWDSNFVVDGLDVFPQFQPVGNAQGLPATWIGWWAIFNPERAQPTDFETTSYYVNDRWQLNENWSFNLGVRYDTTDGTNGGGAAVLNDEKWSPRLGATWDVKGDGDVVLHASAGTYVAAPASTVADSTSSGGALGVFLSQYGGPAINADCNGAADCIPTRDALQILFDWYLNEGGGTTDINGDLTGIQNLISVSIPGVNAVIPDTLVSPSADELAVGLTKRLGNRGLIRADVVYREFGDFYSNRIDTSTGQVPTDFGPLDLALVGNFGDAVLEREYRGLHLQGRYRVSDRLTLAGNYTLSETEGNIEGETANSGPVSSSPNAYPEYFQTSWAFPVGNLNSDQRHKLRMWAIYDLIDTEHHNLSLSLLQNFFSGAAYSLFAGIDTRPFVANPGYVFPPSASSNTYFYSDRGEFTYDDVTRTDLALNYAFLWNAFGRQVEVFVQPEVLNVFDEDALVDFDTRIRTFDQSNTATACNGAPCQQFDPFTETPLEGVHWAKRSTFGQPLNENDFQTPRTFRFSVGFRF